MACGHLPLRNVQGSWGHGPVREYGRGSDDPCPSSWHAHGWAPDPLCHHQRCRTQSRWSPCLWEAGVAAWKKSRLAGKRLVWSGATPPDAKAKDAPWLRNGKPPVEVAEDKLYHQVGLPPHTPLAPAGEAPFPLPILRGLSYLPNS